MMLILGILLLLFWTLLFFGTIRLLPGRTSTDYDTKKRLVSIFHGLSTLLLCANYLWKTGMTFCDETVFEERLIILFSLTYYVYHFGASYYFGLLDSSLVFHHTFTISGFLTSLLVPYGAKSFIYGLFITDLTNFPMHLRIVLRNKGKRHTKLYEVMESIYLTLYIGLRGVLAPYNLYTLLSCSKIHPYISLSWIFVYAQSLYFVTKMLKIMKKKILEYEERAKKGVSLWWLEVNPGLSSLGYFNKSSNQGIF